jgi:hypothetical protein
MTPTRPAAARLLLALAAAVLTAAFGGMPRPTAVKGHGTDEAAVRRLVKRFGGQLQKVSLLAPDVAHELDAAYGDFVAPSLLAAWKRDLRSAPGRLTSSPWPDRVEVDRVRQTSTGYTVEARVVSMTADEVEHGGDAGSEGVVIRVSRTLGRWLIVGYAPARPNRGEPEDWP